ncbi:MAG: enoyl-CoA hydratase/isomerase family protein [Lautropia sp.]|nr:enoyl-CoA hydratase/isomerase family protein [Lautropia sp.]
MADPIRIRETATACGHRLGIATLDAPSALNALSLAMVDALQTQLTQWATDPDVVAVVLDGTGEKAFCAGGDLRDLYQSIRDCGGAPNAYARQFFTREYRLDYLIHTYPKPLLCWGNGIVMGGGLGLMAGASHRIVTERTRIAMPEIGIGLFPDVGGSWFLNRMPARTGLFLALTGAPLNAADALFAGLADCQLPQASHGSLLEAMARTRWHRNAGADAVVLSHLVQTEAQAWSSGQPAPADAQAAPTADVPGATPPATAPSNLRACYDEIRVLIGHDGLADIAARLEQAAGTDTWIGAAASNFRRGSPTSAALAYSLLRRARHLSLREVFQMELDAAVGCCAHQDFAEGIRALLIDKDRQPRWQPAKLADVDAALVEDHFKPRYAGANPLADLR